MTRRGKVLSISAAVLLLVVIAVLVTAVALLRTGWVEEKIRQKIVASAETATGGKVELGALHVDWKTWTATVDALVIHGTEPAGAEPLLAIRRVVVGLKIISFIARDVNVESVEADDPRVNLIIQPDGATNLPQPKTKRRGKPIPETILGLKIAKFDLLNGVAAVERQGAGKSVTPWNARGANLRAMVTYNGAGPRYDATISVAPLDFVRNPGKSEVHVAPQVALVASMEKNRVTVSSATVKLMQSEVDLSNVLIDSFTKPVTTGHYRARVALSEADAVFHLVNFRHTGTVSVEGNFRYASLDDYSVAGDAKGSGIGYGKVKDVRVSSHVSATPRNVILDGLVVNALGGELRASGQIRRLQDVHLAGRLDRFDARVLASFAGMDRLPWDGIVSGPFDLEGKLDETNLHNLVAEATLAVAPAPDSVAVHGTIAAKYSGTTNTVELGRSWVELPSTRLDVTGTLGQKLDVRLATHDLGDLAPVVDWKTAQVGLAAKTGAITFEGTVTGGLADPRIAGRAIVQNASVRGQQIDSLTGDFTAMKSRATVTNTNVTAGNLRGIVTGSIDLHEWKPSENSAVSANVRLINADATKVLALAGGQNVPVTGTLNTTAQISGTVGDPHATADLTLAKGEFYGEPYDNVAAHVQYLNSGTQAVTGAIDAGRKRMNATLRLEGAIAGARATKVTFNVSSNAMAINQIAFARKYEPMLGGTVQVKADGVVQIDRAKVDVLDLNGDLRTTGLTLGARSLGDAHMTAATNNGVLTAKLESDLARSTIRGDGTVRLAGDYPINAKLTFAGLGLRGLAAVVRGQKEAATADLNIDGSAAGEITLSGPAKSLDAVTAAIEVAQLEVHPLSVTGAARNIPNLSLKNNGPLRATLTKSALRIESARFAAPSTDLTVAGTVALDAQSGFDLRAQGTVNLALIETLNSDLSSSGELSLNATVRGGYRSPDIAGRAELRNGDFHLANFSNGLTNANGVILFSGTRATIQSLAAESGGGKVNVTGFGALANGVVTYGINARTQEVRVRYPEGVSSISDADVTLSGTSERSQVSGTVTVRRVSINPKTDISTILAGAAQPLKTPEGSTGVLSNMNLDVQIETAPDVTFETNVAQSIQADASLRLRGTATNPAVLGRVNITQGEASFFGNKYNINQGSISFFNPAKIDPVLNIDLETKARGVDVVLTVTGPLNKLNVSYRSDPPLQFSDIVGLLATGRTPTDPTLAVRDTGQSQTLQQMGATALIGQAIANPVAGRLQRFFGVSKIKIDPQLTGITGSPEARLTIEQQVSPELLFTYITDVSSTSTQLIRVEWDFNRRWSAILTREENGYVGLDFAFRKRFR